MKKLNLYYTGLFLIVVILSSCKIQRTFAPFFRSLIANENVYKTQDSLKVYKVYKNYKPAKWYKFWAKNEHAIFSDTSDIFKILPKKNKFIRYSLLNDTANDIIRILPVTKFESRKIVFDSTHNNKDSISYYYFKIAEKAIQPYQKFLATEHITAIPLTIPFKYRFNTPNSLEAFSTNVSIAYGFGYRIRINNNPYKENYIRLLVATGLGTDKYTPKDSVNVKTYKPTDQIIWTYSAGITIEMGNRFNTGIFLGKDRMFGDRSDWFFQNKAWAGIGFGYKFK